MLSSRFTLISALALMVASPVVAQSTGFYYDGVIALDYARNGGTDLTAGLIDMNFGIAPDSAGSFGGVGFEAGVWAYQMNGTTTEATGFAAVTFGLGGGVLHVGAPRSGSYGYFDAPLPSGARAALMQVGIYTGSLPYSTIFAASADRPMLGVMYERESGPLRYSVSYGQINAGGALNVFALGAERSFGDSRVYGTLEHVWATGGNYTTGVIGGSTMLAGGPSSLGQIEVGGALSLLDQSGGSTASSATIYATASMTDRLDVTASALHLNQSGSGQTIFGVNAAYDIWNGVHVNAGVAHSTGGGSGSTLWTVGLFREF